MEALCFLRGKKIIIFGVLIASILFIGQINSTLGITLAVDQKNDVQLFENGIFQRKGNYRDEIDILGITFVGVTVTLYLEGNPIIDDGNHNYRVEIYWQKNAGLVNSTIIEVGQIGGLPFEDTITYNLVNETGAPIQYHPMVVENTTVVGTNTLSWDINFNYLTDPANPVQVNATSNYLEMNAEGAFLYEDLSSSDAVPPIFSTQNLLPLLGTLLVVGFAGYTLGSIIVYYLTTNIRSKEKNAIFMGLTTFALAIVVHWLFWVTPWQILWDSIVYILAAIFGFIWANRGIMKLQFEQPLPEGLPIETEEEKTAVVILAKGEAEDYTPLPLIRDYHEFKKAGIPQKSKILQPFEFFKMKQKYKELFSTQENLTSEDIAVNIARDPYKKEFKKLMEELKESFLDVDIYQEAYVNDWPTINQSLLRVISLGANNITILNLLPVESFEYQLAMDELKKIDFSDSGITIKITDFLISSEKLVDYFVKKIESAAPEGKDNNNIGILLVANGQPQQLDERYNILEEINRFNNEIIQKITKLGFNERLIENAWIDYRSPDVIEGLKNLLETNTKTIITVATTTPISCIDSLVNIEKHSQEFAEKHDVEIINLGAWDADEEIVKIYLSQITSAQELNLEEFGKDAIIVMQNTKYGAELATSASAEQKEQSNEKEDSDKEAKNK